MVTDSEPPDLTYTTLKPGEIRLLSPVDTDDGLVWNLQIGNLKTGNLSYDALSYTWGPQANTFPILCNGKVLRVHHNLFSALPFLARRTGEFTSRPIWVDAVCINQADEEEKLTQIRMMNTIYRRAKKVWVWLGLAPTEEIQEQIPRAVTLLPHIVEENMRQQDQGQTPEVDEVVAPLRNAQPLVWKAISHLMRNPYFGRVWVVQETALATDIAFLCGKVEVTFDVLGDAIDNDSIYPWKPRDVHGDPVPFPTRESNRYTLFLIRKRVRHEGMYSGTTTPRLLLQATLLMSRQHDCFDAKDRVFGTLGLVKEEDLHTTGLELQTCTTVQDLYTHYGAYILFNTDPNTAESWWNYFNSAFTFNKPAGLPSWIPDLHHQKLNQPAGTPQWISEFTDQESQDKRYQASGRTATVRKGAHVGEMILRGKIIDEIVFTHPTPPEYESDDAMSYVVQFADWEKKVADVVLGRETPEDTERSSSSTQLQHISEETYWRTLLASNLTGLFTGSNLAVENWRTFLASLGTLKGIMQRILDPEQEFQALNEQEEIAMSTTFKVDTPTRDIFCALFYLRNRQLFNTAQGSFGFAIKGVEPGDVVCVFNHATTPHVLRKVEDREGHVYRVVGDAYVHDFMHGQVDEMDLEERDIVLV